MKNHYTARRYEPDDYGTSAKTAKPLRIRAQRDGGASIMSIHIVDGAFTTTGELTRQETFALRDMLSQVLEDWA